jgi:hypothetical protein
MAAGQGFKTFTTGEVLTAADTNGYLMQGVLVFASAAARSAAITSPQEGQMSFLKDTNSTEYYSGSAWVAVAGGSSPLTTKGDLYTYSTTDTRLAVGANGTYLVADSTAATGLKWAAAGTAASGTSTVNTSQTSTSTSYTDLATAGPAVTLTTGTKVLVIVNSQFLNQTVGNEVFASCAVSGASTVAASDDWNLGKQEATGSYPIRAGRAHIFTGLTAGSNTFTMKYRVGGGTGQWEKRELVVMDLGS